PLKLEVGRAQPAGPTETIEVPAQGFDFGDYIVGTTDPATPDEPFHVKELSSSPNDPDGQTRDPFAFRRAMQRLEGRPAVVQVRRYESAAGAAPVNLLVPPAYLVGFGLRMQMGPVVDIR